MGCRASVSMEMGLQAESRQGLAGMRGDGCVPLTVAVRGMEGPLAGRDLSYSARAGSRCS